MEFLKSSVLFSITVLSSAVWAVDYEKNIPHDKVCVVEAMTSAGAVYLKCKNEKAVLKTEVDLAPLYDTKTTVLSATESLKLAKKIANLKTTYAFIDYSLSTGRSILITFNADKTFISGAAIYGNSGSGIYGKPKLDL